MPTLSLKVSDDLDRSLAAMARHRGMSKSALIREAMADFVAGESGAAKGSPAARDAGDSQGASAKDAEVDEYGW